MSFGIWEELAFEQETLITSGLDLTSTVWTAPRDYPRGTQLLFHVDNHGSNEYMLIEVNLL